MKVNYATIIADTISVSGKSRYLWLYAILVSSILFNVIFLLVSLYIYFNEIILSKLHFSKISIYQEAFLNFLNSMDQVSLISSIIFIQGILILFCFFMTTSLITLFYGLSALQFSIRSAYGNSFNSISEASFFAREKYSEVFKITLFAFMVVIFSGIFVVNLFLRFMNNPLISAFIIIFGFLIIFFLLMMSVYWFYFILFKNYNWKEALSISFKLMFSNFVDNFLYLLLGTILKSFLVLFSMMFFIFLILGPIITLTLDFWTNIQLFEINLFDVGIFLGIVYFLLNFSSITTSICVYFVNSINLIYNEEILSNTKSEELVA